MMNPTATVDFEIDGDVDIDPIEEIRLRTWARTHYAPCEERDGGWHPIVLDEMKRKDREGDKF